MSGAAKEPCCFEGCRAKDGRVVHLTKKRYDGHVLSDHPDLERDFTYPVSEIQKALETADTIRPSGNNRLEYIGPVMTPDKNQGFSFTTKPRRMHVIVEKDDGSTGHVVTAFTVVT